jgi:hypothetical protein
MWFITVTDLSLGVKFGVSISDIRMVWPRMVPSKLRPDMEVEEGANLVMRGFVTDEHDKPQPERYAVMETRDEVLRLIKAEAMSYHQADGAHTRPNQDR